MSAANGRETPIDILGAHETDAEEILTLQLLAYRSEAEFYDDWTIPPLTETIEQMRMDIDRQTVLKACAHGRIVGSVRARQSGDRCMIGRLIVHPEWQRRGIGSRLLREIESCFPETARFELFTGERSESTIRLYVRMGYRVTRREAQTPKVGLVFLEKETV